MAKKKYDRRYLAFNKMYYKGGNWGIRTKLRVFTFIPCLNCGCEFLSLVYNPARGLVKNNYTMFCSNECQNVHVSNNMAEISKRKRVEAQ